MKVDLPALAHRALVAVFVMDLVVFLLYVFGTYQSFQDSTLKTLVLLFRGLSWSGLVLCPTVELLHWTIGRRRVLQTLVTLVMLVLLAALYALVEFLKVWIFPGVTP